MEKLPMLSAEPADLPGAIAELERLGVRFVFVGSLPGAKIDGAAFWLDPTAPVVAVSLRFDRIDSFWFTLMHELAHIHEGHAKTGYLDTELIGATVEQLSNRPEYEKRANRLASQWLIPEEALRAFVRNTRPYFGRKRVREFASRIGVHPGIVVGRLQFLDEIDYGSLRAMQVKVSPYL